MKAAICTRFGGPEVIEVREVPKPKPKTNEVLVRVRATTVSSGDDRMRALDMPKGFKTFGRLSIGFRRPRQPILGFDMAGDVEAVGSNVRLFRPGDAVVAVGAATHAEFALVRESKAIVKKPKNVDYDAAASHVFGGITAVYYLRDLGHVTKGQRVLIYGASGAVGTASLQLAKHLGAHVTAVTSTANIKLVSSLGADEVIDYTKEPPLPEGETFDVLFDTVGKLTYKRSKPFLAAKGAFLAAVATPWQFLRSAFAPNGRIRAGYAAATKERLTYLMNLVENGSMKSVIDQRYSLEEIAQAHQRVGTHRKKGSVVIMV